jgi:hypothetical protein
MPLNLTIQLKESPDYVADQAEKKLQVEINFVFGYNGQIIGGDLRGPATVLVTDDAAFVVEADASSATPQARELSSLDPGSPYWQAIAMFNEELKRIVAGRVPKARSN